MLFFPYKPQYLTGPSLPLLRTQHVFQDKIDSHFLTSFHDRYNVVLRHAIITTSLSLNIIEATAASGEGGVYNLMF